MLSLTPRDDPRESTQGQCLHELENQEGLSFRTSFINYPAFCAPFLDKLIVIWGPSFCSGSAVLIASYSSDPQVRQKPVSSARNVLLSHSAHF